MKTNGFYESNIASISWIKIVLSSCFFSAPARLPDKVKWLYSEL
jgi:hypothetical protein